VTLGRSRKLGLVSVVFLVSQLAILPVVYSQDNIMGQLEFTGVRGGVKSSGVWIDGQYIGYLGELNGRNKPRLLPGEHQVVVRQAGYDDFSQKVVIEPGKILRLRVVMRRNPRFQYPKVTAEVKLNVKPGRAAVFLDDYYVGHVGEFSGVGRAMLVSPGKHRIKVALPGYKTFETSIDLLPNQKFTLQTELMEGSINDADPLIKKP
jgi:hypothetical protein